jgi:hypothetical protein
MVEVASMNYKQVKDAAQSYVDRYDQELVGALPGFTKVVESKINTALKTGEQAVRAQIWLERDKEYYGLPSDWGGFRDVELVERGSQSINEGTGYHPVGGMTLIYVNPEQMNGTNRRERQRYYTVIANQIQVSPPTDNQVLEVVYYQTVPPLSNDTDTNWLTEKHPDAYIFGLCAEICAFAKDAIGFELYKMRFMESIMGIAQDDQVTRWSGPSLRTYTDGLIV